MTMVAINNTGKIHLIICDVTANSLPDIWLKKGNNASATKTAIIAAARVTMTDSIKNWAMRYFRGEPNTFLMPTSLALFEDLAVERFMKLIHAINKIKIAMAEKIY